MGIKLFTKRKILSRLTAYTLILTHNNLNGVFANIDTEEFQEVTKSVFANIYPLTSQFRSGPRNAVPSYEKWKELQFEMDGHTVDLQTNVLRFAPENYEYANQYAAENPEMVLMSTWRGASGNPKGKSAEHNGDPLGESVIEFPGHFVYSPGTYMTTSTLSTLDTTLTIEDPSKIIVGPAILVEETISSGEKNWNHFEYIEIKQVRGNLCFMERAFNGSPPSSEFSSNNRITRTYVANMPWDWRVRADYTDWFINYSADCPLDSNGQSALDVVMKEMVIPMKTDKALSNIGGLDLASGPFSFAPENADYNVDGIMDDESVYWDGVKRFYNRVWNIMGEERLLLTEFNFDMTEYINGPNQEGLAKPNDPWEEVSRTVNNVLAWKVLSDRPFASLAFVQYMNREEDLKRIDLHRLLNGYATCLGMAADVNKGDGIEQLERDELFMAAARIPHWLGRPTGPLIRPATLSRNLLLIYDGTSSNDWNAMIQNLRVLRADLSIDGDELVISPNGSGAGFTTFYLDFEITEKTDITVFMEAISDDSTLTREIKLPRISVPTDTKLVRATLTNKDYLPISWLIRGATPNMNTSGSTQVQFDMRIAGGGNIRIRKLSVHAQTDTLACQFEQGIVLVNPSLEDVELDLKNIFPDRSGYRRLLASPVSKDLLNDKYHAQYDKTMEQNDGSRIINRRSVLVGERNALFLKADPIAADPDSSLHILPDASIQTKSPTPAPTRTTVDKPYVPPLIGDIPPGIMNPPTLNLTPYQDECCKFCIYCEYSQNTNVKKSGVQTDQNNKNDNKNKNNNKNGNKNKNNKKNNNKNKNNKKNNNNNNKKKNNNNNNNNTKN